MLLAFRVSFESIGVNFFLLSLAVYQLLDLFERAFPRWSLNDVLNKLNWNISFNEGQAEFSSYWNFHLPSLKNWFHNNVLLLAIRSQLFYENLKSFIPFSSLFSHLKDLFFFFLLLALTQFCSFGFLIEVVICIDIFSGFNLGLIDREP